MLDSGGLDATQGVGQRLGQDSQTGPRTYSGFGQNTRIKIGGVNGFSGALHLQSVLAGVLNPQRLMVRIACSWWIPHIGYVASFPT